jgi:hypothetical protein
MSLRTIVSQQYIITNITITITYLHEYKYLHIAIRILLFIFIHFVRVYRHKTISKNIEKPGDVLFVLPDSL